MKGYIYCIKLDDDYKIKCIDNDSIEKLYDDCLSNDINLQFIKRVSNYERKYDVLTTLLQKNNVTLLEDIKLYFELMDGLYIDMNDTTEFSSDSDKDTTDNYSSVNASEKSSCCDSDEKNTTLVKSEETTDNCVSNSTSSDEDNAESKYDFSESSEEENNMMTKSCCKIEEYEDLSSSESN
jgi:hypothetical protein